MLKKLILIFFLIQYISFAEIILDVSDTTVSLNQTFNLSVIFKNEKQKKFKINGIENFKILTTSTQSNTSIINTKVTKEIVYNYKLLPIKEGEFKLFIKNLKSNEIFIKVTTTSTSNINQKKDIFFKTNDLKKTYYYGEKIVFENHLISKKNINGLNIVSQDDFTNFSKKDMTPKNYDGKYIRIEGEKAIDLTIQKYILTPIQSGKFEINPTVLEVTTTSFDSFFDKNEYISSEKKSINILPLPEKNKPQNFSGIVGDFKVDYKYEKQNNNIVLKLKIRGEGNLDYLENLNINSNDFNIFQSVKNSNEIVMNNKVFVEKEFEIIFIPNKNGKVKISEIKIPYFNINKKDYENLIINKQIFNISGVKEEKKQEIIKNKENKENKENKITEDIQKENTNNIVYKEVEIKQINKQDDFKLYFYILLIVNIFYLLIKIVVIISNKKNRKNKIKLKNLKNSKNIKEFYNNYIAIIKNKYNINLKNTRKSELKKINQEILEIFEILEEKLVKNKDLNKTEKINLIKEIKKICK
ncbi:oxygen tolerance protein BatD [Hypnocyclicus thermotrophus]|uniref:Oxygen tolerance protein BatD n=1 Tax=Hypnocyclicus thermotrophus TaxID=1627895 RepID=A0AA46I607_9FUSO|nr:BatD family protein [Hypnocyclicus thermotrophus]TDT71848.1 oxygen tolerance protein BatD [Hypnocyclicus thermotrophus]